MKIEQFEVRKDDLAETRVMAHDAAPPDDGEIVVRVDRFALTANNVTYGVVGERIGYWKFFPVDDPWGIIPVWGFAEVVDSRHADVAAGERLYGYFPTATHLRLRPGKVQEERLVDAAPHRAELPAVYNAYARTAAEPWYDASMDDERMLLFPLYATSFCIADFLSDNEFYGATRTIVCSASSKTAIGLAYALRDDVGGRTLVGLTSRRNVDSVRALGLYDEVAAYDDLADIDAGTPTVIVDMSGNGEVLSALHALLGDNMRFTSNVGITHYDANVMGPDYIAERSAMFFAPGHIKKRAGDWGPGEFEKRALEFWHGAALRSRSWLTISRRDGMPGLEGAYKDVLAGTLSP